MTGTETETDWGKLLWECPVCRNQRVLFAGRGAPGQVCEHDGFAMRLIGEVE